MRNMKITQRIKLRPLTKKRKKCHGFRKRKKTSAGRKVIKRRTNKKRKRITV